MRVTLPGPVPSGLAAQRRLGPEWADWLDRLPALAAAVAEEWDLAFEGPLWHGFCSLVAPVRTEGGDAVVKIGLPDDESEHEHLALQRWRGRGAVRLLRADPARRALLLERLDRTDLSGHWDEEACAIVARLYGELHVPPMPQLRAQAAYVERWVEALVGDARAVPVPRRLVEQAASLAGDLCREPATAVLHADLHYENVLLAERDGEPAWVAIDPKPANGDPHYELAPMLLDRFDELGAPGSFGSVREQLRRRFHVLVDAAGFDEARARAWVVVRTVLDAHWAFDDARRARRPLTAEEQERITRCITVAKAVQD